MSAPFSSLDEALAWLDTHIDFESKMPTRRALPTLERMWELVHLLGDPQEAFAAVHLTGTNGKGSTAAMVSSLMQSKGLSVGTYTSPNLERVNDRLARGGRPHRRRPVRRGPRDRGPSGLGDGGSTHPL